MNRSRPRWIAALVVSAITAAATLNAAPEHVRLTAMVGVWDVEMTFWLKPGGPGVTTRGTATIRPLFDGLFIEETIEATLNGTPFTTLSWTGFNIETRQYEATRIASMDTIRIAETGSYDEKTNHFELKADYRVAGDPWHQRTIIQPLSPEAMIATSYVSFGKISDWKAVEIKYSRRTK